GHTQLDVVDGLAVQHGERVDRAGRERQRAQPVERGEEIVGGRGRGDRLLRREGRLAERRVVVARGVLDAPALAYLLKRLVGKSRRRVNERDVVVVERVERGRDD